MVDWQLDHPAMREGEGITTEIANPINAFAKTLMAEHWLMTPEALDAFISRIALISPEAMDELIKLRIQAGTVEAFERLQAGGARVDLDIDENGTARIPLHGIMMRQVPSILDVLGIDATSTDVTRQQIAAALDSDFVARIVLDIDSPGGHVDGTAELAEDVFRASAVKPLTAEGRGQVASAAFWVASQAERLSVGPTTQVGSIGTVLSLEDRSAQMEKRGIKTHVIASHPLKGIGMGPVTEAQLNDLQRVVDSLNEVFVEGVQRGRGMTEQQVRKVATGQVFIGQDAVDKGLADQISTFPLWEGSETQAATVAEQTTEVVHMSTEKTNPAVTPAVLPEDYAQLKADKEAADKRAELAEKKVAAAEAIAEEAHANQRVQLMDKYKDRIPPSAKDAIGQVVEAYGSDFEGAEEYLQKLPKAVRDTAQAVVDSAQQVSTDNDVDPDVAGGAQLFGRKIREMGSRFTPVELVSRMDQVKSFSHVEHTFTLKNGEIVDAAEYAGLTSKIPGTEIFGGN